MQLIEISCHKNGYDFSSFTDIQLEFDMVLADSHLQHTIQADIMILHKTLMYCNFQVWLQQFSILAL